MHVSFETTTKFFCKEMQDSWGFAGLCRTSGPEAPDACIGGVCFIVMLSRHEGEKSCKVLQLTKSPAFSLQKDGFLIVFLRRAEGHETMFNRCNRRIDTPKNLF